MPLPPDPPGRRLSAAPARALVVGIVAGRGGAGASTLAAAVAAQLARRTATVLVDLDRASAGVDVLLGLEAADGVRWPDLADARGEVSGADVLALLPRWGACAVLSADRARPGAPEPAVVADVLHALTGEAGALVLDLDRGAVVAGESLVGACDAVLVVAPRDLRTVAGILAMRPHLGAADRPDVARRARSGSRRTRRRRSCPTRSTCRSWPRSARTVGCSPPSNAAVSRAPAGPPAPRLVSSVRSTGSWHEHPRAGSRTGLPRRGPDAARSARRVRRARSVSPSRPRCATRVRCSASARCARSPGPCATSSSGRVGCRRSSTTPTSPTCSSTVRATSGWSAPDG